MFRAGSHTKNYGCTRMVIPIPERTMTLSNLGHCTVYISTWIGIQIEFQFSSSFSMVEGNAVGSITCSDNPI